MHQIALELSAAQAVQFDELFYRFLEAADLESGAFIKLETGSTREGEFRTASFDCRDAHLRFTAACAPFVPKTLLERGGYDYGVA